MKFDVQQLLVTGAVTKPITESLTASDMVGSITKHFKFWAVFIVQRVERCTSTQETLDLLVSLTLKLGFGISSHSTSVFSSEVYRLLCPRFVHFSSHPSCPRRVWYWSEPMIGSTFPTLLCRRSLSLGSSCTSGLLSTVKLRILP